MIQNDIRGELSDAVVAALHHFLNPGLLSIARRSGSMSPPRSIGMNGILMLQKEDHTDVKLLILSDLHLEFGTSTFRRSTEPRGPALFQLNGFTMSTTTTIRGAELVAFLRGSPRGQTKSILIEAERPTVSAPSRPGKHPVSSPRRMLPPPAATLLKQRARKVSDSAPVAMGDVEQALKRLGLDGLARRNDLNGSFAVEATAAQIRELAATPGVQAIRPNRRHRNIAS